MSRSTYWAVISTTGDEYLNGTTVYRYTTAVSSASEIAPVINITFSIASFDYLFASQFVDYDWITLVGQMGGAAALASASHMVIMAIFAKLRKYYYRYILHQEIDDEGEEKAVLPESIAVVDEGEVATPATVKGGGRGGSIIGGPPTPGGSSIYETASMIGADGSKQFDKKKLKKRSVKRYSVVVIPQRQTRSGVPASFIPAGIPRMSVPPPPQHHHQSHPARPHDLTGERAPFLGYHYGEEDSDDENEGEDRIDPRNIQYRKGK